MTSEAIHRRMEKARNARWAKHYADPDAWFWDRVDQTAGRDACWPWLGRLNTHRRGYGRLTFNGRDMHAHRLALILAKGEASGMFACHSCDNPICCNPAHLWWGTPRENTIDCQQKGRLKGCPRKFDRDELVKLRKEGRSYSELAAVFGVNQTSIGRALRRYGLNGSIRPNQNAALKARA